MDALNEMDPTATDTFDAALTKQSTSQEAMDTRINEMSKKFEERNTTLTNQFNDFPEGLFFAKPRPKLKFFKRQQPRKL